MKPLLGAMRKLEELAKCRVCGAEAGKPCVDDKGKPMGGAIHGFRESGSAIAEDLIDVAIWCHVCSKNIGEIKNATPSSTAAGNSLSKAIRVHYAEHCQFDEDHKKRRHEEAMKLL